MKKTIKEIATELNVSEQSIYDKIKKIDGFKSSYVVKDKNGMKVNDDGFKKLKNYYFQEDDEDTKYDYFKNESINSFLLKQLEEKDKQLIVKDEQISKLSDLLDHSQQLQLQASKDNQDLKEKLNESVEINDEHEKVSFWSRLFHR